MPTQLRCDLDDEATLARWRNIFCVARASEEYKDVFRMASPLVSVCISTADRGAVLAERALASIIAQTYKNLQVVIVGDQCEDDTSERIAALQDDRFIFENLPRRGPYPPPGLHRWMVAGTYPANRALELVRGQLVTHIDEDDTCEPDRIAILVEELQKAEADLVFHPFWWQNDDGGWFVIGNGRFDRGEVSTGMVLYHSWLARIPADVYSYRMDEPGDWNRFRKMAALGARIKNVPHALSSHWRYPIRDVFVAKENEEFLA